MCKIGTPSNMEDFIIADRNLAVKLSANGFNVEYKDKGSMYFRKTDKLIMFLNNNLNVI
jgi:hypothetical protein